MRTRARKAVTQILKVRQVLNALLSQPHRHPSLSDHGSPTSPTSDVAMKSIAPDKKGGSRMSRRRAALKKAFNHVQSKRLHPTLPVSLVQCNSPRQGC